MLQGTKQQRRRKLPDGSEIVAVVTLLARLGVGDDWMMDGHFRNEADAQANVEKFGKEDRANKMERTLVTFTGKLFAGVVLSCWPDDFRPSTLFDAPKEVWIGETIFDGAAWNATSRMDALRWCSTHNASVLKEFQEGTRTSDDEFEWHVAIEAAEPLEESHLSFSWRNGIGRSMVWQNRPIRVVVPTVAEVKRYSGKGGAA